MTKVIPIFISAILATNAIAGPLEGHLETRKYVQNNNTARTDNTGTKAEYGLDIEFRQYFLNHYFHLMAGFDADTDKNQFARVAGRVGAEIKAWQFDVGYYHRSNHNLDYSATQQPTHFISTNYVYIRYNFSAK
jgi:hypothetical protein